LQIAIHNIVQHSQIILLRLQPSPLHSPRIGLRLPRDPPRHQSNDSTNSNKRHRTSKTLSIPWSILRLEDLRANRTTNLSVAVHEADRETTASRTRRRLDSPRPHEREKGCGACVADEGRGVYGAVGWEDDQHSVASYDDREYSERVYWAWESGVVGEEACDADDCDREE
jgi:hypothetical protein